MGNDPSKNFLLEQQIETVSRNIWTLYNCSDADNFPLSVFIYDLTSPNCKPHFVENAAKYLKILRHPYIVKFHALSHSSKEAWLVTERVLPLETLIESLSSDEILAGLYNLVEALSFLHDRGGLCHNNISLSSVFVAEDGTWKLGAMECVCRFAEASSSFLLQHLPIRSEKSVTPEEKEKKLESSPAYSRDAYALGIFAEYILEYLTELGERLSSFQKMVHDGLLSVASAKRPKLSLLLDDCLFRTEFIEIWNFLKQITMKTEEEKSKFFKVIVQKLYKMPEELIAKRLVNPLLSRFVVLDCDACEHLMPHLLTPATGNERSKEYGEGKLNPILAEPLFKRYIIPELYKIFHVRDAHIRSVLLLHFPGYAEHFDLAVLAEVIYPQILLSVRDANDELVMLSLKAVAHLVPILGGDIIVGGERPKLFYEGNPKFAVVNGHVNLVANGLTSLEIRNSNSIPLSSGIVGRDQVTIDTSVESRRQLKKEEARRRMEERRKKQEEQRKLNSGTGAAAGDLNLNEEEEAVSPGCPKLDVKETNVRQEVDERSDDDHDDDDHSEKNRRSGRAPKSPSLEPTDSEIELEIEAELEEMKQAEKFKDQRPAVEENSDEIAVRIDWSDVGHIDTSPHQVASKQTTRGKMKLILDNLPKKMEVGSPPSNDEKQKERTRKPSADVAKSPTVETKTDDLWNDAGWVDFDNIPQQPSSPLSNKDFSSPVSSPTKKFPASSQISRMKSTEEPLGAGYDIMLVNIKKKEVQQSEEFDFFADMAPNITSSSGSNLINILSGGKPEKGKSSLPKTEKSSANKNLPQAALTSVFDVKHSENATVSAEASGWDDELDWNIDDKL